MKCLRQIPQLNKILLNSLFSKCNKRILKNIANAYLKNLRNEIINKKHVNLAFESICNDIYREYVSLTSYTLRPVINASGVVLQTNLGRSILSNEVANELIPILTSYSNLEYDLDSKKRGERYSHLENMLCLMFNVESALIVNNNAAAVFLILNTFANNKEVIISRGELVEVGGSFRIPNIMQSAGCKLVEVGTTNRTNILDYENALSLDSSLIIKVHKSNYYISGFTSEVSMEQISSLCKKHNLIDYYDLGSGYVDGFICNEDSIHTIASSPPSLFSFSGDKLFGSIQAGIILGKRKLIDALKKNHLLRILRVDKSTICILQSTLKRYINNNLDEIPTLKMLSLSENDLQKKALNLLEKIPSFFNPEIIKIDGVAGGGSLPNFTFPSIGISIFVKSLKLIELEKLLRKRDVITRIQNNKIIFDVRTIKDCEINLILNILKDIKSECKK